MKNHKIQWLAALLACAMLSGCGDDGETTESTGIDSGGNGGGGGGPSSNHGRLQFSVSSLTVAEDAGNATVTVTRTGGSDGAVSVTVTSRDGSATQPADYTAVSTTVSFAAGDTAAKTVNVPIINDTTPETAETLYLTLSAVTGGAALGSTSEALITITDNDVAPPTASRAVISSAGPGKLRIDWTASTGATSYRVMKDATGSAGFTQVGADLPASARFAEVEVSPHLEDWTNGRYAIAACNAAGCTQSAAVDAAGLSAAAITYVKAAHSVEWDWFGSSVALSGDGNTLAVSALGDDAAGTGVGADPTRGNCNVWPTPPECVENAGAVYVFTKTNGTWSTPVYIKAPTMATYDRFGTALALTTDGNTLVVTAPGKDNGQGAAYVYTRTGGTWQQSAVLTASDAAASNNFGESLALLGDGSLVAIGAPWRSVGATLYAGGIYVFSRSGETWTQEPTVLTETTPVAGRYFGQTIALGGTSAAPVLAAGVPNGDVTAGTPPAVLPYAGTVLVFTRSGATWTPVVVQSPTPEAYDWFGGGVALSADGTTLAIGDDSHVDVDGTTLYGAGRIHVFTATSGTWTHQAQLQASNPQYYTEFGASLALSADGSVLVVGDRYENSSSSGVGSTPDELGQSAGAAYLYRRTGTTWSEAQYIKPSNTHATMNFGAVALDSTGNTLAVGASGENGPGTTINGSQFNDCTGERTQCAQGSGAVYVY